MLGCYGVQDSDSVCSTDSPCPTTPWFCDSCKAGLDNPECELCPNPGMRVAKKLKYCLSNNSM